MQTAATLIAALHLLAGVYWLAVWVALFLFFFPVYHKYNGYVFFENFRQEYTALLVKSSNLALVIALLSGSGLFFIHRNPQGSFYSLFFTIKMLLLFLAATLVFPWLKISQLKSEEEILSGERSAEEISTVQKNGYWLLLLALGIVASGLSLQRLAGRG